MIAEDLVHVDDGAQRRRARPRPHPGHDLVEQKRHEEHALCVVQMRDREDGHARLAGSPCTATGRRRVASPVSQGWKPGEASRLLSSIASAKRSFDGKNDSISMTPTRVNGGDCTARTSPARSSPCPSAHAPWRMVVIRMCSRLRTGSASMPRRDSRLEATPPARSASRSAWSAAAARGGFNDESPRPGAPRRSPACRPQIRRRARRRRSDRRLPPSPRARASTAPLRARRGRPR